MKTLEKNVSVKEAAKRLGIGEQHVRMALQQKTLPIGAATKLSDKRWAYHISPALLEEYVSGRTYLLKELIEQNKILIEQNKMLLHPSVEIQVDQMVLDSFK